MAKELNEDTGFNVSIKTLAGIGFAMATVISMWFMLQADIEEGYSMDFDGQGGVEYLDPSGNIVATSTEIWEGVVIPTVLSDYTEKKRNELENTIQHSLIVGFDYYLYICIFT